MKQPEEAAYRILLFYKYVHIEDPERFAKEHLDLCHCLELKGRVLIAHEGINGTVSGTYTQTGTYMDLLKQDPRFSDIVFKIDETTKHAFRKMHVRARDEIVSFRLDKDVDPNQISGKRLSPKRFYEQLQRDDIIVIDGRNDYEYDIGHFRGAIRPEISASRDFPEWIRENLSEYKDKPILTYCTGGIRCEKLSGFLLQEGFRDVSQLEGGIISYGKDPEVQGKLFDGKCYVFDDRIAVRVNRTDEDVVIAACKHCGKPSDRYVNCANTECDLRFVCCSECEEAQRRRCSDACLSG